MAAGRGSKWWVLVAVLALGWLAGVLWRVWLGHPVTHPVAHTDEDSYMNAARAIAGGPGGFSSENTLFRRIGYPLFVSPAFAFGLTFTESYRIVQVLNAIVNAATLPLAYLLARRMFRMEKWPAVAVAFAAGTLPAAVFWSLIGMTDSVLAPLVLGWLLAIHWWVGSPGRKWAAVSAGVVTGLIYLVHIRGTLLVLLFLAFLVLLVIRRRVTARMAALSAVPLIALIAFNQLVITLLGGKVHLIGSIGTDTTAGVLTSGHRLQVLLTSTGTSLWYLCVVSAGLAGIGWAVSAREMWRPTRDAAFRWTAGLALFSTVGVALGAAAILAGLTSANADAIYSRYVQMFVPFWLVFGFAVLLNAKLRTSLKHAVLPVLVLAVGGGLIALRLSYANRHGTHLAYGAFGGPDLMTITAGWTRMRPLVGVAIGVVGLLVLLVGARTRKLAISLLAVIVLANGVTMVVMRKHILIPLGAVATPAKSLASLGVGPGDRVAFAPRLPNPAYYSFYHDVSWSEVDLSIYKAGIQEPPADINVVIGCWGLGADRDFDGTKYGFHFVGGSKKGFWAVWRRDTK
ncbi:hypothetical protein HH310_24400 [Actinoplanes sp. TBRC 11911]|uniref:hypothetical protein n=1 Tax=Actinoplanes sp. TBRC 11911 TaxID=2729386 RepID=UPI00145CC00C|nr:hypothetical protein [Actinoplanes sp. TBRC 11911]NMO54313.1 hypothetical protein [Actinoplanes sp. TBRC 11911]